MCRKIRNPYYIIWADLIIGSKKNHPEQSENAWKFWQLLIVSLLFTMNFIVFDYCFQYFNIIDIPLLNFKITPVESLNVAISLSIEFLLPFFLINYYFIFYKDKYKKIIEKYPEPKKAYSFIYGVIVIILWLVSSFLYWYLTDPLFIQKITGNV